MTTYVELMAQAKTLMEQAEQSRKAERSAVLAEIRSKMVEYGITVADLGGAARGRPSTKLKVKGEAKYRGPNGELWSGMGRRPAWANEALAAGKSLSDFAI